jgi:multiple antibiotic resistance protein
MVSSFALAFVALFVAMDPVGSAPTYFSLVRDLSPAEEAETRRQSLATAAVVSLAFAFVGKLMFLLLGITVADFQIAGGLVLLVVAILDMLGFAETARPARQMGVVPIGVPLIAGPAALTTVIMQVDIVGTVATVAALLANLVIVWVLFRRSRAVHRMLGEGGGRAVSKIVSLLLAAIAVMMIRRGILAVTGASG